MAIQVSGTTVIDNSRNISNVGTVTATSFSGDGSALTGVGEQGIGISQTWQDVKTLRANLTVYQNTTDRPICLNIVHADTADNMFAVSTDNITYVTVAQARVDLGDKTTVAIIIPPNHYYKTLDNESFTIWTELR